MNKILLKEPSHIKLNSNVNKKKNSKNHAHPLLNISQRIGNKAMQRLLASGALQAKLKISKSNDKFEREADKVANQVNSPNHGVNYSKKNKLEISRKVNSSVGVAATESISQNILAKKGKGNSLDSHTKSLMESKFGEDFSSVKIHTDTQANKLAKSINARAFTVGNDIFFGNGESTSDKKLVSHELTHVVQQQNVIQTNQIQRAEAVREPVKEPEKSKKEPMPVADKTKVTEIRFDGKKIEITATCSPEIIASGNCIKTAAALSGLTAHHSLNSKGIDYTKPEHQDKSNKGPIPAGTYTLNPSNVEEAPSAAWGNWRVYLDPGTISKIGYMFGLSRGGFFLHGDHAKDGTAGCIGIQDPAKEDKIFTMIKQTKTSIKVVVSY